MLLTKDQVNPLFSYLRETLNASSCSGVRGAKGAILKVFYYQQNHLNAWI